MSQARIDWRWIIAAILVVILFVPMRRYVFPVSLPFDLEPYRILVALVLLLWALSLLAQPDVAFRRSGLDGPMLLFAFALVASDFANPGRMAEYESYVLRGLTLALSVVVFFYFVVSVVRTFSQVLTVVKLLVVGTTVLAVLALIESRTGWSPFDHFHQYFPFLIEAGSITDDTRQETSGPSDRRSIRSRSAPSSRSRRLWRCTSPSVTAAAGGSRSWSSWEGRSRPSLAPRRSCCSSRAWSCWRCDSERPGASRPSSSR